MSDGYKTVTCAVCGDSEDTSEIRSVTRQDLRYRFYPYLEKKGWSWGYAENGLTLNFYCPTHSGATSNII